MNVHFHHALLETIQTPAGAANTCRCSCYLYSRACISSSGSGRRAAEGHRGAYCTCCWSCGPAQMTLLTTRYTVQTSTNHCTTMSLIVAEIWRPPVELKQTAPLRKRVIRLRDTLDCDVSALPACSLEVQLSLMAGICAKHASFKLLLTKHMHWLETGSLEFNRCVAEGTSEEKQSEGAE